MSRNDDIPAGEPRDQVVEVPGAGPCLLPHEFAVFTGPIDAVERHDARESLRALHARLAAGAALVLAGPYPYVDAVFRYCQRFQRRLVAREQFAHVADRAQRRDAVLADSDPRV